MGYIRRKIWSDEIISHLLRTKRHSKVLCKSKLSIDVSDGHIPENHHIAILRQISIGTRLIRESNTLYTPMIKPVILTSLLDAILIEILPDTKVLPSGVHNIEDTILVRIEISCKSLKISNHRWIVPPRSQNNF